MNTFKTSTISKEGNKNILRNSIITRYLKGVGEYHCTYLHYLTLQKKKIQKRDQFNGLIYIGIQIALRLCNQIYENTKQVPLIPNFDHFNQL